ncbi:MAG: glycoside hydrolase family 3 N-terminal domain-containing protein [Pedococcus sp.]
MTAHPARHARIVLVGLTALALTATAACDTGLPTAAPTGSATGSATSTGSATASGTSSTSSTTTSAPSCGEQLAAAMTAPQRAGQLLMVGLQPTGSSRALAAQIKSQGLGGVIYLGGWPRGTASMSTISKRLTGSASDGLLVAADQEGGQVQQLRGAGFSRMPSARIQAASSVATEERNVEAWSRQLARGGVNINLAPVADTVPTSLGAANQPIGRYRRDFAPGSPLTNARYAAAFVRGTLAAGIAPTVKHFPGLGRITGNTDVTSTGIIDRTASADDPYLAPFAAGIEAGAPLVMISSARYPRLDPDNQAMFSKAVITGLLRESMGFDGVVITDDVGAAKAVAAVPVGQRATRFIAAGGDIVLTAKASQASAMLKAIAAKRTASPAFAAQVDAAAARVLGLKADLGLVKCS